VLRLVSVLEGYITQGMQHVWCKQARSEIQSVPPTSMHRITAHNIRKKEIVYNFLLLSNHHRDFLQQIHRLGRVCDPRRRTR